MKTESVTVIFDPIEPKHRVIFRQLAAEIAVGKYVANAPLPSERLLMHRFGVARQTIRQAVEALLRRGLVNVCHGRGTFVAANRFMRRKVGVIMSREEDSEATTRLCAELKHLAERGKIDLIVRLIATRNLKTTSGELQRIAKEMVAAGVAGVIYHPVGFARNFERRNRAVTTIFDRALVQVVLIGRDVHLPPERGRHDVIGVDHFNAGRTIARHLYATGARCVRFLTNGAGSSGAALRREGFCAEMNVPAKEIEVELELGNRRALSRYLREHPETDAFVCADDQTAEALVKNLRKARKRVPEDIRVVGYGDKSTRGLTLTTIHPPYRAVARLAFDRLKSLLADPSLPACTVQINAPLVVRESTERK